LPSIRYILLFSTTVLLAFSCEKPEPVEGANGTLETSLPAVTIITEAASVGHDTIPDFSTVGFRWGEKPFPTSTYSVVNLPAPSGGDDTPVIQDAVDRSPEGTVLQFQPGRYVCDGSIVLDRSGVVLRGAPGKATVLFARGSLPLGSSEPSSEATANLIRDFILVGKSSPDARFTLSGISIAADARHPDAWTVKRRTLKATEAVTGEQTPIIEDAFCGDMSVRVKNPELFAPGESVAIFRPATKDWIHDIKMDMIIRDLNDTGTITQWKPSAYSICWSRRVVSVEGDRIFLDAPVVMSLTSEYGGGTLCKYNFDRIHDSGLEDLVLESDYDAATEEKYPDSDIFHACSAVVVKSAEHCWIKDVETRFFSESAVELGAGARNITVTGCSQKRPVGYVNGGLRYAFHISRGELCLVEGCTSEYDRHQFVQGAQCPGPNVFLRDTATNAFSVVGPHQRWASGALYDHVSTDNEIRCVDAGNSGTGHGWQGVNQVFWCCTASAIRLQSPWVTGLNYAIGCAPASLTSYEPYSNPGYAPDGSIVSDRDVNGTRPEGVCRPRNADEPEFLYDSQLSRRLSKGKLISNTVL